MKTILFFKLYCLRCLLYPLFIAACISCGKQSADLEWALGLAGDNRAELEKVLEHYSRDSADSLKYRAAAFLITNMPAHYTLDPAVVNRFCDKVDSVLRTPMAPFLVEVSKRDSLLAELTDWREFKVKAFERLSKEYPIKSEMAKPDIRFLTSDFLIRNIDEAFEAWQSAPWASHVDFDHFCEYILPYKVEDPFLPDDWRRICRSLCDSLVDLQEKQNCQYYKNSSHWAARFVNTVLKGYIKPTMPYDYKGNQIYRVSTFLNMQLATCREKSLVCQAVMRSKGIPVTIDFTPQWPSQPQGHSWNIVLTSSNGRYDMFSPLETDPGMPNRPGEVMAKVYRHTYAIDPGLWELNHSGEYVPYTLRNSCLKDVTADYMSTSELKVGLYPELATESKYAYLSVFDNKEWVPIDFGKIENGKVRFRNMGRDIAYMPQCYLNGQLVACADPFVLDAKGEVRILKADTSKRETMTVRRKYTPFIHVYNAALKVIGGKLQAANLPDFSDSVTVHEFREWNPAGDVAVSDTAAEYRYWRYLSAPKQSNSMAELMFYPKDSVGRIRGEVIGTEGTCNPNPAYTKQAVFDGDPFTYYDAADSTGCWAGMDFGRPVKMEQISFVCRSDDNNIRIGDSYELFYWAGSNGWRSLGQQDAKDIKLYFEDAPQGALFLLKDYTRGKDERVFTYRDGRQVWW